MNVLLELLMAALLGLAIGIIGYRNWASHNEKNKKPDPVHLKFRTRLLISDVDFTVLHWLRRVFFDHQVLIKVSVIRFLRCSQKNRHSLESVKDVYCTFTICSSNGAVIGCIDVPDKKGLQVSKRDLKKKLLGACGLPYAVLSADAMPTLESMRTHFLGKAWPDSLASKQFEMSNQSHISEYPTTEAAPPSMSAPVPAAIPGLQRAQAADLGLSQVANARSDLHSKLEQNRKERLAVIESLRDRMRDIEDNTKPGKTARWDDSFIMGENSQLPSEEPTPRSTPTAH